MREWAAGICVRPWCSLAYICEIDIASLPRDSSPNIILSAWLPLKLPRIRVLNKSWDWRAWCCSRRFLFLSRCSWHSLFPGLCCADLLLGAPLTVKLDALYSCVLPSCDCRATRLWLWVAKVVILSIRGISCSDCRVRWCTSWLQVFHSSRTTHSMQSGAAARPICVRLCLH